MSASQSIANNTNTALLWGSEYFDTDSFHSTATNTGRITIPSGKDGYYLLSGLIKWDGNTAGRRYYSLRKNGSFITGTDWLENTSNGEGYISPTFNFIVDADATDYFEIFVNQSSGGGLDVTSDGSYYSAIFLGA